jgi:hypothetical protein
MNVKRVVGRFVAALALAFIGAELVQPPDAAAETMLWTIRSNYKYKVQIEFYSDNRAHAWPGGNKAYNLNDYETHEYNLNCHAGEKVCFGAWVTGNAGRYWGVGANHRHSCSRCCFTCGGGDIPTQVLNN